MKSMKSMKRKSLCNTLPTVKEAVEFLKLWGMYTNSTDKIPMDIQHKKPNSTDILLPVSQQDISIDYINVIQEISRAQENKESENQGEIQDNPELQNQSPIHNHKLIPISKEDIQNYQKEQILGDIQQHTKNKEDIQYNQQEQNQGEIQSTQDLSVKNSPSTNPRENQYDKITDQVLTEDTGIKLRTNEKSNNRLSKSIQPPSEKKVPYITPIVSHVAHQVPISALTFLPTEDLITCGWSGEIKYWRYHFIATEVDYSEEIINNISTENL